MRFCCVYCHEFSLVDVGNHFDILFYIFVGLGVYEVRCGVKTSLWSQLVCILRGVPHALECRVVFDVFEWYCTGTTCWGELEMGLSLFVVVPEKKETKF